ncbi:DUF4167 domain-containing protein [Rhodoligotrophos ferricapiens]|uniref:DUF4167 domain-containing protein n=1 Tax=Rhodoligotrophos ferricapiens TaxID=3069264 RepID=UPI00315D9F02
MRQGQHNNNNKRSRNRGRRQPNPASRVFESNGPDVRVRGTASHIAEKYLSLGRDAQASGDIVQAENYFQHAEHYLRIVAAAQAYLQQQNPEMASRAPVDEDEDADAAEEFGDRFDTHQTHRSGEPRGDDRHREHSREGQRNEWRDSRGDGERDRQRDSRDSRHEHRSQRGEWRDTRGDRDPRGEREPRENRGEWRENGRDDREQRFDNRQREGRRDRDGRDRPRREYREGANGATAGFEQPLNGHAREQRPAIEPAPIEIPTPAAAIEPAEPKQISLLSDEAPISTVVAEAPVGETASPQDVASTNGSAPGHDAVEAAAVPAKPKRQSRSRKAAAPASEPAAGEETAEAKPATRRRRTTRSRAASDAAETEARGDSELEANAG